MSAALCCAACIMLLALTGCFGGKSGGNVATPQATSPQGGHMSGAVTDVHVTPQAIASRPKPWVLTSPESSVRSYLDWTSYAYRIGTSAAASATMGAEEFTRVDAYTQLNLEKSQLLDQTLTSLKFGMPSVVGTATKVPTREDWSYRYVSIKTAGQTVGGPYTASYEATYTVVKSYKGEWLVTAVDAKAQGPVK